MLILSQEIGLFVFMLLNVEISLAALLGYEQFCFVRIHCSVTCMLELLKYPPSWSLFVFTSFGIQFTDRC